MRIGGVLQAAAVLSLVSSSAALADPPPLEAFAALPGLQDPRLSPDGMSVAMITPIQGTPALVTRTVDGSKTAILTTGETLANWFHWKSDTRLMASLRLTGLAANGEDAEFTRLMFVDADGKNGVWAKLNKASEVGSLIYGPVGNRAPQFQDRIISLEPNKPDEVLLAVPPVSDWIHPEVVKVDIATGHAHPILREPDVTQWWADADGEVRAAVRIKKEHWGDSETHRIVIARLPGEEEWQTINEGDENQGHRFHPVGFDKDRPSIVYVMADNEAGRLEAREYDLSTHALGAVIAAGPVCDAASFGHDNELIGFRVPCEPNSDRYLDPGRQRDWRAIRNALHADWVFIRDRTADGKRSLAEVEQGPSAPHSYWILDRHGEKPELSLFGEAYEKLKPEDIAPTTRVAFAARDGQVIPAFLTLPANHPGPLPFVVLVHGGLTAHNDAGFNWIVQFLASRGYGVLQPQFRGSSGFGAAFQQAGYRQWGGMMQDDVTDGTRWLISQKLAEPGRVCIAGAGYGGYSALMGLIKEPALYACGAAYGPITDLSKFIRRMRKFAFQDINRPRVKGEDQDPDDISPVEHADQIRAPVLLVHGRKDVVVPAEHSEDMERALRRAGKTVEAVYLDQGDSAMRHGADRQAWLAGLEKLLGATIGTGATAAR